jgi:hypothetical protein
MSALSDFDRMNALFASGQRAVAIDSADSFISGAFDRGAESQRIKVYRRIFNLRLLLPPTSGIL